MYGCQNFTEKNKPKNNNLQKKTYFNQFSQIQRIKKT